MNLTVVSSLDALCRQQACEALAAIYPAAAVIVLDLLENGTVIRRTLGPAGAVERHETVLEHNCLGCTVRLDLVPAVEQLLARGEQHIIVGLPSGVEAGTAISALRGALGLDCGVSSAIFACAPDSVEDPIWDHHTLFESGFTPVPVDERTPGEFLIGELSFCDTVLAADPDLVPVAPEARARGLQLLRELAPHADIAEEAAGIRAGRHDYAQAVGRTLPGTVSVPADPSTAPFTTVIQRIRRPLHPERFRHALAAMAAGCCWLRGQLWIATAPDCRIAVHGIGPRIWLENTGPWPGGEPSLPSAGPLEHFGPSPGWHSSFGGRGTWLAATGDDLDAEEIGRLLASCQLTDAELAAGTGSLSDPFDLARQH
ncbi:GTP-binding protein [Arthrobacter sp. NPDC056493]|uniref:GTP-binding protein n=1 Tax=Arthrobacter sp. NPDC056493 TaxID=3345839 RepID=UPI00366F142C